MENASASKKAQKAKAKARKEKEKSYELQTKRPLSRNGWFAFALCPICICAMIVVLWAIAAFA